MDSRTLVYVFNTSKAPWNPGFTVRIEKVDLDVKVKIWKNSSIGLDLQGDKLFPELKDVVLTDDNVMFTYRFTLHPKTKLRNNDEFVKWAENNKNMILSEWSLVDTQRFYLPEEKNDIIEDYKLDYDIAHPGERKAKLAQEKAYFDEVIRPTLQYRHRVKRVQKEREERKEKPVARPKAILIKAKDLDKAQKPAHYKLHVKIK